MVLKTGLRCHQEGTSVERKGPIEKITSSGTGEQINVEGPFVITGSTNLRLRLVSSSCSSL